MADLELTVICLLLLLECWDFKACIVRFCYVTQVGLILPTCLSAPDVGVCHHHTQADVTLSVNHSG